MNPERTKTINGTTIEEYYWAGKFVVYINNKLSDYTFEQAIKSLESDPHESS